MDYGVHPILNSKIHYQIIFSKLNLKIEYLPLYYRYKIWNYNKSKPDLINTLLKVLIGQTYSKTKNVHEQVELCNKTLLKFFHNFIPSKIICPRFQKLYSLG